MPVDDAVRIDAQSEESQGSLFVVRRLRTITIFVFNAQKGADVSSLPDEATVVNRGLTKLYR